MRQQILAIVQALRLAADRRPGAAAALAALLAVGLTAALRAVRLGPSFNIFIDEVTYVQLAQNAVGPAGVSLYGRPFFLHPPAFFYLEGAYLAVVRQPGALIAQIYAARGLVVLFAALSAALVFVIVRRCAGTAAAGLAALLFACDPFVIRMNSLVLLDTPAMFWVLAGYALLLGGLPADLDAPADVRAPLGRARAAAAGLAFGLAILTKDMMAAVTLVPLLACALLGWVLPRRRALLAAAAAGLTYLAYLLGVALAGQWSVFAAQKSLGLQRVLGGLRITGLNRPDGPALGERVLARLGEFGPTYLLIGLGLLGLLLLLPRRSAAARLLALWMGATCLLLAVCLGFGTIEEQFFYWLVVAAAPVGVAGAALALRGGLAPRRLALPAAALLLLCLGWSALQWARVHTTPDNGYEQALALLEARPAAEKVAATSETGQFLMLAQGRASGPWGKWSDPAALEGRRPRYLLISTLQLVWDRQGAAQRLLGWAEQHGRLLLRVDGHRDDTILLYQIDR